VTEGGNQPRSGEATPDGRSIASSWWRNELWFGVELFTLTWFVVARPLLSILGNNTWLLLAWQTSPADLAVLVGALLFGPLIVVWLPTAATRLAGSHTRRVVHALAGATLVGVGVLEDVKRIEWPTALVVVISASVGVAAGVAIWKTTVAHRALRVGAAFGPALFTLLFLITTPALSVVNPAHVELEQTTIGTPSRVVLLVLDEFPLTSLLDGTGEVDADLYPNFARLANDATWYRNTTTVAAHTDQAVPAVLSGRLPTSASTIPVVSEYPRNLFSLLGGRYAVNARESVTGLCPTSVCRNPRLATDVEPGLVGAASDLRDLFADVVSPTASLDFGFNGLHSADPAALDTANRFLAKVKPTGSRPRLDFAHILLPHFPWHYLRSGQDYTPSPPHTIGLEGQHWINEWAAGEARHRHLLQTQATDTYVGTVLDRLIALGEYDDTMFVVTADHGAAFTTEHPFRGIASGSEPDIAWIPLFVKYPGGSGAGEVDDRPALSVDVLPTIVDVLDIDVDWPFDGRSLRGEPRTDDRRPILEWERNELEPDSGKFVMIDGERHFAAVLERRASPGPASDAFRLQRVDAWGVLIGEPVDGFEVESLTRDGAIDTTRTIEARIDGPKRFANLSPLAPRIPWLDFHATMPKGTQGKRLVVVVNGTIAAALPIIGAPLEGDPQVWGTLPISLFEFGANDVSLYLAAGTPDAITLVPVAMR
jgi:Sulfatase